MKVAYFDCFSGVSGDMALGALLACGADVDAFRSSLAALNVPGYDLEIRTVRPEGISAVDVDVRLHEVERGHGRHLSDIAGILAGSALPERVRENALRVFTRLADAEAAVHGVGREEIHFHEVGAIDAIVDIVGACILLEQLGVERVVPSTIPCGHGTIRCQHGIMPVPAPATLRLLEGFPVVSVDIAGELVTPTGAALITALGDPATAGRMPAMRILASGFGAGKKQFVPDMPNVLRVVIGEIDADAGGRVATDDDATPQSIAVLETNLDDLAPEAFDLARERCVAAGALDVFFTPIQMKKGRPAVLLTALCPPECQDAVADALFRETGTFGVRMREQSRYTLQRSFQPVATPYGEVRLKIGRRHGEIVVVAPEYEDCRRAAIEHDVPLRRVYQAALSAGDLAHATYHSNKENLMQQRTYHGSITPDGLADALVQHFSGSASSGRSDVRAQKVGQGTSALVQIGIGADPNDRRYVPLTFAIAAIPGSSGVIVTDGQRQWVTPDELQNAALWVFMGVLFTPFALFGLLWPLSEIYSESLIPREAWGVVDEYAALQGATLADSRSVDHPHAGAPTASAT